MKAWLWLLAAAGACGGDGATTAGDPMTTAGNPVACDLPPLPCPAGERPLDDGSCLVAGGGAGIDPDDCGEGFVADGDRGCTPILPDAPCPEGQIAVPGDEACRPVVDCGSGNWGNIPVEANTVYVDASYQESDADGSAARPYASLPLAIEMADEGAIVAVAAGEFAGPFVLSKRVRIWGRCPTKVRVTVIGGPGDAALVVAANDVEVHAVGVTGTGVGIKSHGDGVLLDGVWVYDVEEYGIIVLGEATVSDSLVVRSGLDSIVAVGGSLLLERSLLLDSSARGVALGNWGPNRTSAVLHRVVIRGSVDIGLLVKASDAEMYDSVVADVHLVGSHGAGVWGEFDPATGAAPAVRIARSAILDNDRRGISVRGEAIVEHTVIRGTRQPDKGSDPLFENLPYGISIRPNEAGAPARSNLAVRNCMVDDNDGFGIGVIESDALLDRVIIRASRPLPDAQVPALSQGTESFGHGLIVQTTVENAAPSNVKVSRSQIVSNTEIGVRVLGGHVDVDSTLIADTQPNPAVRFGHGTSVQGAQSELVLAWSVIRGNHEVGVDAFGGGRVTIESSAIVETRAAQTGFGWGVAARAFVGSEQAQLTMIASVVADNHEAGIVLSGGKLMAQSLTVSGSVAAPGELYGDGVVLAAFGGLNQATLIDSCVRDNARAGVAVFQGTAELARTAVICNALDLNAHSLEPDNPAEVSNAGGNTCGCGEEPGACKILSATIDPPAPL